MRDIKFRAWSPDKKQMTYLESEYVSEGLYYHEKGTHILMQYTGLKDKNGKEIYEGDVVCHVIDEIVETIGGYPRYEKEGEIITVTIPGFYQMQDDIDLSETEVIGNIYENPELLTER